MPMQCDIILNNTPNYVLMSRNVTLNVQSYIKILQRNDKQLINENYIKS